MVAPKPAPIPGPFPTLKGRIPVLDDVADYIHEGKAKNIVVLAGAGISTSAGIPDFRSPETGLYSNLEKYNLPYPEAIFDIDYFKRKPQAFYTLAKELYPGNFKPTPTHYFFRLLREKGLLKTVFTQNIDTLERMAGLDDEHVVEAHGSFAEAECLECEKVYTKESIKPQIELGEVVRCSEERCKGKKGALVKPKIVFFGEGLPKRFFDRLVDLKTCDLLIVMGTSLTVQPFASLINNVPSHCPRLLLNLESVGEAPRRSFGSVEGFDFDGTRNKKSGGIGIRDVRWLGTTDEGVRKLAEALSWEKEFDALLEKEHKKWEAGVEIEDEEEKEEKKEGIVKAVGESAEKAEKEGAKEEPEAKTAEAEKDETVEALTDKVEQVKL